MYFYHSPSLTTNNQPIRRKRSHQVKSDQKQRFSPLFEKFISSEVQMQIQDLCLIQIFINETNQYICLNLVLIIKLIKMKSKKKLIYKLHENINQNPFKKIDQISFRNAGIGSYDFNKLKSIRAISLKGLPSDQIHAQKHSSDLKQKYDLKMNMVSIKEDFQQKAHQALICNKKKIVVDKSLISMQPKKLNVRTLIKQKHLYAQHSEGQNPGTINSTDRYQENSDQGTNNQNNNIKLKNGQRYDLSDQLFPINRQRHSRNVSLPVINGPKQEPQNSMTFISSNKQLDMFVEQQRAKQQILKQIRVNAQEKINKQVLMSIKLKSIQNLERIARSQSQVIKIDKWKEKYSQLKNPHQINLKEKHLSPKNFLPEIEQKLYNKDGSQNSLYKIKPSHRYMEINEEEQVELQKSQIQLAKDLLYNVTLSEAFPKQQDPLFSYNSTTLYRRPPESMYENMENKMGSLEQYYQSQILQNNQSQTSHKNQSENGSIWHSQPLKITITKMKSKKNKHNQILSTSPAQNDKPHKQKGKKKLNSNHQNLESKTQTQTNQKSLEIETTNPPHDQMPLRQQNHASPTYFKTKSKLYVGTQKSQTRYEESSSISPLASLSSRRIHETKCKINEGHNILDKIVQDGMPQQWEQKRFGDQELSDFDIFVQSQAKKVDEA